MTTTLDPASIQGTGTLSGGNLTFNATASLTSLVRSTVYTNQPFYFEGKLVQRQAGGAGFEDFGVILQSQGATNPSTAASVPAGLWLYRDDGNMINSGAASFVLQSVAAGDIVNVACNPQTGKLWFGHNGVWGQSGNPATGANPQYSNLGTANMIGAETHFWGSGTQTGTVTVNFGDTAYSYTPPAGFGNLVAAGGSSQGQVIC